MLSDVDLLMKSHQIAAEIQAAHCGATSQEHMAMAIEEIWSEIPVAQYPQFAQFVERATCALA